MYELKVATQDLNRLLINADPMYPSRTTHDGRLTIFATDSAEQMANWDSELATAGVQPIGRTRENADPCNPDSALVAQLAESWSPFATRVEDEFCVGWTSSEPSVLVRAISRYLADRDPSKGAVFDKQFLGYLD